MAERRPKHASLERVLGVGALFSTAYGNVGSSIYYALGVVAVFALGLTPMVFLISGIIFMMTAATYAEATVMYPEAGGSSSFARHAFNELVSFIAAWGQLLNYIITVAISAFFVPHYLSVLWKPLDSSPADIIGGALLIGLLVAINVRGTKESARVNMTLAIADLLTQALLVALGLVLLFSPETLVSNVVLGVAPSWGDFALGIAVGMIAYTGIETLSNMSEEAKDAGKTVPRAVGLVVGAVLLLYLLIPMIALSAMPVTEVDGKYVTQLVSQYSENPMLGIVDNVPIGEVVDVLRIYVGILAAVILIIATNAGLIGVSRLTYSMGQYRQVPKVMRSIHPKFRTPYVALLIFGGVAILTLLPGQTTFLATMYSFGAMLSFTIAHAAMVTLRVKRPEAERQYRVPFNIPIKGKLIPITAILGGLGTLGAWVAVMALHTETLFFGTVWMLMGFVLYFAFRRRSDIPLTLTTKIKVPKPVVEHEVEYKSVLVVFDNLEYSRQAVATAIKLAARKRRGIHLLVTITVPMNLPPDARLREEEARAAEILEDARFVGGRRVTGEWIKVRPGGAGARIVAEALDIEAKAIVVPLARKRARSTLGDTVETLLERRPCRIIIDSSSTDRLD